MINWKNVGLRDSLFVLDICFGRSIRTARGFDVYNYLHVLSFIVSN
jgi:hypothetical protein